MAFDLPAQNLRLGAAGGRLANGEKRSPTALSLRRASTKGSSSPIMAAQRERGRSKAATAWRFENPPDNCAPQGENTLSPNAADARTGA